MTAVTMSSLPYSAGSALAATAGRTAMWVVSAYMQAPLRNTAIAALIGLSAMAGSNALYKQAHHHPAPLFGSFAEAPALTPVMPAAKPRKLELTAPASETTGSVETSVQTPAVQPISRDDVAAVQQKLKALQLFDGKVDGLFGPRTAASIRAFEQSIGLKPMGELTPKIIATIETATPPAIAAPVIPAAPAELVIETPAVATAPLAVAETQKPLPPPAPLLSEPVARSTPALALATPVAAANDPAGDAIDAVMQGVETLGNTISSAVTKRSVQTIAVNAQPPVPTQAMPAELIPPVSAEDAPTDVTTVAAVQRGLNSLGFLHGEIDGVAGEATAKAIRNFEVYYNYDVTGRVTPGLVKMLVQNGAVI